MHITHRITMFVLPAAFVLLTGCLGPKPVQLGDEAYDAGDYATAGQQYQLGVDEGDPEAQFALGLLYSEGKGVAEDPDKAVELFMDAAMQDHVQAAATLGIYYYYGINVPQNYKLASGFFALGAIQGDALSIDYLSHMLENGLGVDRDPELAASIYDFMRVP